MVDDDHLHVWAYGKLPRSSEPYRTCMICETLEVYYLDDLAEELRVALSQWDRETDEAGP